MQKFGNYSWKTAQPIQIWKTEVKTNMMIITVQQFITKDKKNTLIKCIKGSPTGCKNYLHEVFRMLKQHGKRTLSLT